MTTRNVLVDLRARTGQYERQLRGATRHTAALSGAIESIGGRAAVASIGALTGAIAGLGVASAAVGIAGAAAFAPYEKSLSKMVGLVGVATEEVERFDAAILDLAGETARAPQELADAMFFVTSAGLEGAQAIDALTVSAKASTAGLGDTAVIADVVTSAMNAYGDSIGGAAQVTDVLVAAVREGKAEASELAGSIGRVIPIASQMGISFDQVGAAIAAMTRTGLDANESTTALRGILNSLLAPSADAVKALDEVGLSAQGIRDVFRDRGLFEGLQGLATAFAGQEDATTRVFGNVRALTGVLSLLGSNAEATKEIFGELATATGALDTAFEAATSTDSFPIEKAINDLKVSLIDVGRDTLPLIADTISDLAPLIPPLVEGLGELSVILFKIGGEAASKVVDGISNIEQTIRGMKVVFADLRKGADQVVDVFDFLGTPLINFPELWTENEERAKAFAQTQIRVHNVLRSGARPFEAGVTALKEMLEQGTLNIDTAQALQAQLGYTNIEVGNLAENLIDNAAAYGLTAGQAYELSVFLGYGIDAIKEEQAAIDASMGSLSEFEAANGRVVRSVEDLPSATARTITPLDNMRGALKAITDEGKNASEALLELVSPTFKAQQAVKRLGESEEVLAAAQKKGDAGELAEAQLAYVQSLTETQAALSLVTPGALEGTLQTIKEALGVSYDEAIDLLNTLGVLDGTQVSMVLEVQTEVTGPLAGALSGRGDILSGLNFTPQKRQHGGPVAANTPYLVGEDGKPELFVPRTAGTIISNQDMRQTMSRSIVIDMSGSTYGADLAVVQERVQSGLIAAGITEEIEWAGTSTIR